MLKFFFWILLIANAALFAYQRGVFGHAPDGGREPARMSQQLNRDKIQLMAAPPPEPAAPPSEPAAPQAAPAPAPAAPAAPTPKPAAPPPKPTAAATPVAAHPTQVAAAGACTEIGNFDAADAQRFAAQLTSALPAVQVSRRSLPLAASHIVYIPPQGSKEGAEKKAGELRRLGINDFFIIQDDPGLRWGISLGVFKQAESARAHLVELSRKGVHSARLGDWGGGAQTAFQIRGLDAAAQGKLDALTHAFPKQVVRACAS